MQLGLKWFLCYLDRAVNNENIHNVHKYELASFNMILYVHLELQESINEGVITIIP